VTREESEEFTILPSSDDIVADMKATVNKGLLKSEILAEKAEEMAEKLEPLLEELESFFLEASEFARE
jgi:hypothetical protein